MRLFERLHGHELFGQRGRLRVAHLSERRRVRGRSEQLPVRVLARLRRPVLRDRAGPGRHRVLLRRRLRAPRLQERRTVRPTARLTGVHLQMSAGYGVPFIIIIKHF